MESRLYVESDGHPELEQIPAHVAVIMDGNGRWAQARGLPRLAGHRQGASVVRKITTEACKLGIKYLTLYSFSSQNWKRPLAEVTGLMELLYDFCGREEETLLKNNVQLQVIGRLDKMPAATRMAVQRLCSVTAGQDGMRLTLALDYGGREELTRAVKSIAERISDGSLSAEDINEETVRAHLDSSDLPDPDLLIRTSGEYRLSNFLSWQAAYSELYFTPVFWPDFTEAHLVEALHDYNKRQRRFGGITELSNRIQSKKTYA
jgi:undecaprenyl diphosphate synthase